MKTHTCAHTSRKKAREPERKREDNKCLPALCTWEARQENQKFEAGLGLKECKASLCDREMEVGVGWGVLTAICLELYGD